MFIEWLLINEKKNLHFVGVIAKPKNVFRKIIQTKKLKNCIDLLFPVYKTDVK